MGAWADVWESGKMRIVIDLDRVAKRKLRIRSRYSFSDGDDVRLQNCGVELYNQWENALNGIKCDRTVIVCEGESE